MGHSRVGGGASRRDRDGGMVGLAITQEQERDQSGHCQDSVQKGSHNRGACVADAAMLPGAERASSATGDGLCRARNV